MAIEALVGLGLAAAFLVGLALYADRHRAEDQGKDRARPSAAGEDLRLEIEGIKARLARLEAAAGQRPDPDERG